ncbi:MAG: hypothetical protein K2F89_04745 [Treponemataceae bacterium]|nr:hypothetical protein [Treponemataceae bacterium]
MSIPKVVHFLWMSETKDKRTLECLETWKTVLRNYEIREWSAKTFPYKDFIWTKTAAEHKKWAFVTDFFRLWVLEKYGGIYLDADIVLHKNFDDFLENSFFIGTEFSSQLGSHCMGSVPCHPFVLKCLEFYKDKEFFQIPIPHVMTYTLMNMYGYKKRLANFSNTPIYISDAVAIYPDNFFTIDISDNKNVAVHLGIGSWRDNSEENPIYTEVLQTYFIRRFYLCGYSTHSKWRRIIKSMLPSFVISLILKSKLKVKHSKGVRWVKKVFI